MEGRWVLPEGWLWRRARDIADIVGGSTPKNATDAANFDVGGTPWLTPADLSKYSGKSISRGARSLSKAGIANSSARLLPAGSVLISSRAPVGYCVVAANSIATNQGFKSLVLKSDDNPYFIRYYITHSKQYLEEHASGTTFKELSGAAMGELVFPVPQRERQDRIVARIDELFAEIDEGERALTEAQSGIETYRKSLLKAAVTGELTADWRRENPATETGHDLLRRILAERREKWEADPKNSKRRYCEPNSALSSDLPPLPSTWAWASMQQLTSYVTSGSRGWADLYSETGSIFIRAANLNRDRLDLSEVARVSIPDGIEGQRTLVQIGDLLITITGANVTKAGIVDEYIGEAYVSQHVALCRPVDPRLMDYLYQWTISYGGGRGYLESAAYGAGKPGLNLDNILEMPVALPPEEEQREIIAIAARSVNTVVGTELNVQTNALRQSILSAAFRGSLI